MKKRIVSALLTGFLLVSATACGKQPAADAAQPGTDPAQAYLDTVDVDYAYELALKLEDIRSNETLGYRTAGSDAELATGDMLKAEMERIGLQNVTKDAFTLDTWTFTKAQLSFEDSAGEAHVAELGGYQTDFVTDGAETFTVIDGGRGTEADLSGLDVAGKLVLVNINQREDWWINYPAYEAYLAGAAAVIAVQDGGYAEVSGDALNAQDVCGPSYAPAFSMSRTDAELLRAAMNESGEATVTLDADSRVGKNGTSYNIVGTIPGRDPESMVLMSAHYDSYFAGFQDDNAAIALMMGIAKGLIDSGYQPEKTLVFCAMAAEEWGVSNTRYDWSTGAYNQIFRVHPEWVGKVIADINFELPAMNEGTSDQIRTSYELKTFVDGFKSAVPQVDGVFPDGIEIIVPTQTWSDDFSLSIAGVPSSVTALRGGFAQTHYHSQFDDRDTYSREAFLFHHNMYGLLMMAYDHCAVSPLDFSTRLSALRDAMDDTVMTAEQVAALNAALDEAESAASAAWEKVSEVNAAYQKALDAGDTAQADALLQESRQLNADVLAAFKFAEDSFVRLTWEDSSFFPHEHSQNNLTALKSAAEALKQGDSAAALDDCLYLVDNNWYAYDWSRETFTYFTDYVLNQSADRLMWGAGRVQGHEDLFDVIRSLQEKRGDGGADYTAELARLDQAIATQTAMLNEQVSHEVSALEELTARLTQIAA